ncbi:MAG: glycerol kinase GlpK [Clostridia bacterium]|nr:glycerol kinase GlpK [Clostridia bacterium]
MTVHHAKHAYGNIKAISEEVSDDDISDMLTLLDEGTDTAPELQAKKTRYVSTEKYILAVDQGTTSSRAIIFDHECGIVSSAQQEFRQIYPRPGWVEHSPRDITASVMSVMAEAVARAQITWGDIAAIGVTNQRETTIVWDRVTGEPVYNAIVWQCRRTAPFCDELKEKGYEDMIFKKTGLVVDAYFSASKIKWILDNVPGARERAGKGELLFGTVDTYIMWYLSGKKVFATDYTNAARTLLFNIHTLEWDKELLELFGVPACMLPSVRPSGYFYGYTDIRILGASIALCGAVGDQQAALYGQLCVHEGDIKNTYGTGCFLLMNTGATPVESKNGLVTSLGACVEGRPPYVLEGSVFVGGAAVQWLRDEMKLIRTATESEKCARMVEDSAGVYVVPAFTGLGAPHWDADARGTICGITRGTNRYHIIRATLEGIAYQVSDVVEAMMKDSGQELKSLRVDGGASENDFLMSFQADILGCDVVRPKITETTAAGAAYLAGIVCGYWESLDEVAGTVGIDETFSPGMTEDERRGKLAGWKAAVKKCVT